MAMRENLIKNLREILHAMNWSQSRLAKEMGIAAGALCGHLNPDLIDGPVPQLRAIYALAESEEIQKVIPFTIDQLLRGDILSPVTASRHALWNADDATLKSIPGAYYVYFVNPQRSTEAVPQRIRRLRYGIICMYKRTAEEGGISVPVVARFFKSQDEADAFMNELNNIQADDGNREEKEMSLFRTFPDTYYGNASPGGNCFFIDLSSELFNDRALLILNAPEKRPDSEYIGGLGNILSISHGSEHIPVSQKVILSKRKIIATDEEIAAQLLRENTKLDTDDETEALLDLVKKLYDTSDSAKITNQILDEADKQAIIRQRLVQLVNRSAARSYNGTCSVTKQDDHACYQFLKHCTQK